MGKLTGPCSIGLAYFGPRYASGRPIEESWIIHEGSDDFAGLTRYTDRYRGGAMAVLTSPADRPSGWPS